MLLTKYYTGWQLRTCWGSTCSSIASLSWIFRDESVPHPHQKQRPSLLRKSRDLIPENEFLRTSCIPWLFTHWEVIQHVTRNFMPWTSEQICGHCFKCSPSSSFSFTLSSTKRAVSLDFSDLQPTNISSLILASLNLGNFSLNKVHYIVVAKTIVSGINRGCLVTRFYSWMNPCRNDGNRFFYE